MWFEMLKGHLMMYHGACMVRLTRLPPSKHVLMLSAPPISKIKNKIRDINELKYKFREVFKALKTNVSQKYFPTTFILVSPVLFAFIS
jgi:zona occludens toxin (predicted ATPase)